MTTILAAPKGFRLHVGIFGRRNVGKSSTFNALTRQNAAIVSPVPGTTTDPIEKATELAPIGPVLFVDAAGIDDEGALGAERVARTRAVFDRTDVGLVVVDASRGPDAWGPFEEGVVAELKKRGAAVLVVANKADLTTGTGAAGESAETGTAGELASTLAARGLTVVPFSANEAIAEKLGAPKLRDAIAALVPEDFLTPPPLVSDLVGPGEFVLLVTPIDKEAPKGRLILPQVQTIRDLLDGDRGCVVVKENLLAAALERTKPALVVTDSQAFGTVAKTVPRDVPLTSFSILLARQKGDLPSMVAGARRIDDLTRTSRVLIAEACSHRPVEEDIGTVKIPNWLRANVGATIGIEHCQGADFPTVDELRAFDLIIHCGACTFNRRGVLSRLARAEEAGVPATNYGLAIAKLKGILDRAVEPFGL